MAWPVLSVLKIAKVKEEKSLPRGGTSLFLAHDGATMDGRP